MFATLDTSSRRLRFPKERDVIITDTVGFIRDLPRDLFNAFKATLEEMEDADLLLHVVDAGNPRFEQHIESVNIILDEIGLAGKEVLVIFNKADVAGWAKCRKTSRRHAATCISARDPATLTVLLDRMQDALWPRGQSLDGP
jgi:GTP-binding protein HflX